MRRGFIRTVWGCPLAYNSKEASVFCENDELRLKVRQNLCNDIESLLKNDSNTPFTVYSWGLDNDKYIKNLGLSSVLMSNEPIVHGHWGHKLHVLKKAFDMFDEFVYLDWDCKPTCKLNNGFWDSLHKKEAFQAPLWKYTHEIVNTRSRSFDKKLVPNGGFIYSFVRPKAPTSLVSGR